MSRVTSMHATERPALLRDIRFWIVLFFAVRLLGITHPPLEAAHNWRQTTVTMVARNFLEVDANILYPRIDIAGELSGITPMEFPLLNHLMYLAALLFGHDHWYGRLIVLLVSSIGTWYFHLLVARYFDRRTAFFATLLLLCSIWLPYSRKIMPDTFSMSLVIIGLFHGCRYLERAHGGRPDLLIYSIAVAAGTLSKLPSGYILPILLLPLVSGPLSRRKVLFTIASLVAVAPALWWYFHWNPYLAERFGFSHFFLGKSIGQGAAEIAANAHDALKKFYEDALKISGAIAFVAGVVLVVRARERLSIAILLTGMLCYGVVILKSGHTFAHHSYYMVPLAPLMALIAARALAAVRSQELAFVLLAVICAEGIIGWQHDLRIPEKNLALLRLEDDLDRVSDRDHLILINSGAYPTPMYFAHRKGWVAKNEEILQEGFIDDLIGRGMRRVVVMQRTFGSPIDLDLPVLFENEHYRIHGISPGTAPAPSGYGR